MLSYGISYIGLLRSTLPGSLVKFDVPISPVNPIGVHLSSALTVLLSKTPKFCLGVRWTCLDPISDIDRIAANALCGSQGNVFVERSVSKLSDCVGSRLKVKPSIVAAALKESAKSVWSSFILRNQVFLLCRVVSGMRRTAYLDRRTGAEDKLLVPTCVAVCMCVAPRLMLFQPSGTSCSEPQPRDFG